MVPVSKTERPAEPGSAPSKKAHHAGAEADFTAAIALLQTRFGSRLATGNALREQHGHTLTLIANQPPSAVLFATGTEEVSEAVRIAADHRMPVIPFGAGTSLEGHLNAPLGGLSIDLSAMNDVLQVNTDDLDCVVQAGISQDALNTYLRDTGLFFPVDPGAGEATLGGMAATRASGTCAVRYGTMRECVLNVTAVMADGRVIKTGGRARKSAAGYDLTRLLVGSEGTLGIITELTVKLFGRPESVVAAVAPFASLEGACRATTAAMQLGLGLARIELLDALQIEAVNAHSKLSLQETPTLFLEFHGTLEATREQVGMFEELAQAEGATAFSWASDEDERRKLWQARHNAFWAVKSHWPGRDVIVTDVCVPISRLAECVNETEADLRHSGLVAPIVGHVGDGNFHCIAVVNRDDAAQRAALSGFIERLAERAIAMDGTCTGEHGIGQGKMALLEAEAGEGVAVMRAIKAALDPLGILNPGKIIAFE